MALLLKGYLIGQLIVVNHQNWIIDSANDEALNQKLGNHLKYMNSSGRLIWYESCIFYRIRMYIVLFSGNLSSGHKRRDVGGEGTGCERIGIYLTGTRNS